MSNRYIEHFRLPPRQYAKASPVVLAAGALLEDTQTPRLIAQLKFINVSRRTITALGVMLRCFVPDGQETRVLFTYESLNVQSEAAFGQYTAITLPDTANTYTVAVTSAVFSDGTVWTGGAEEWKPLRGILALEKAYETVVPVTADNISAAAEILSAVEIETSPAAVISIAEDEPVAEAITVIESISIAETEPAAEVIPISKTRKTPITDKTKKIIAIAGIFVFVIAAAIIILPRILGGGAGSPGDGTIPGTTISPPGENSGGDKTTSAALSGGTSEPVENPTSENSFPVGDGLFIRNAGMYSSQTEIDIQFTELLTGDVPLPSDFTVIAGDKVNQVLDVWQNEWWRDETDKRTRLFISLRDPIMPGDEDIFVSYTQGAYKLATSDGRELQSFSNAEIKNRLNFVWIENCGAMAFWGWDSKILNKDTFDVSLFGAVKAGETLRVPDNSSIAIMDGQVLYGQSEESKIVIVGSGKAEFPDDGVTLTAGTYMWNSVYGWGTQGRPTALPKDDGTEYAPIISAPTLPTPTNLRWEYDPYSPSEIALLWDWMPPAGASSDRYTVKLEYSIDGGPWNDGGGYYWKGAATPVGGILGVGQTNTGGECNFRACVWEYSESNSVKASSPYAEMDVPLTVAVSDAPFIPAGIEYETTAEGDCTLTMTSDKLTAGNIYYFFLRSPKGHMTTGGSRQANTISAADGKIEFTVGMNNFPFDGGFNIQCWEISGQTISGGKPSVTISSAPQAVRIAPTAYGSAPEYVRFETGSGGRLGLVWNAPSWAAEDTWALVEAKRTSDSDWTLVNRVLVKSETRRSVSSTVLHWSNPQPNDTYQFRVSYGKRDSSAPGGYVSLTDYTLCPGTLTFNVLKTPFAATAQYGDGTLTVNGDFEANKEYFFVFDNHGNPNNNYRTWSGFSEPNAKSSHSFDNYTTDLVGGDLYAWELSGGIINSNNASINVSAAPAPVTIAARTRP